MQTRTPMLVCACVEEACVVAVDDFLWSWLRDGTAREGRFMACSVLE